jgi:hypothetical protein
MTNSKLSGQSKPIETIRKECILRWHDASSDDDNSIVTICVGGYENDVDEDFDSTVFYWCDDLKEYRGLFYDEKAPGDNEWDLLEEISSELITVLPTGNVLQGWEKQK